MSEDSYKIYLRGFFLDGPEDPLILSLYDYGQALRYLSKNQARLVDETRFYWFIDKPVQRFLNIQKDLAQHC